MILAFKQCFTGGLMVERSIEFGGVFGVTGLLLSQIGASMGPAYMHRQVQ
jgi:hypothetical protein